MNETIARAFFDTASQHPEREAIRDGERTLTYRELSVQVRRWAGLLLEKGGHDNEVVAFLLPNCAEFVAAYLGTLAAGKTALPINPTLSPEEIGYILQDSSARTLIVPRAAIERAGAWKHACPALRDLLEASLLEEGIEGEGSPARDDLAMLLYTSGTTGRPKGVMLTHGNILSNVAGVLQVMQVTEEDRFLAILPFFHCFATTGTLFVPLLSGCSVEVQSGIQPGKIMEAVLRRGITVFMAVPALYGMMLRALDSRPPHKLRLALSGGEPLPQRVAIGFESLFGVPLLEGYGATETSPVITLTPEGQARQGRSVGPALPNVEMRIRDGEGHFLADGETGEIVVRGPSVMRGYLNRPEETAQVLDQDGWYSTGDLGFIMEDGSLRITGRKKEVIISAGENIYPAEIEEVLRGVPGVVEAAVVGIPCETRGEVPKAFILPAEDADLDAAKVREGLRGRIADFKLPRVIEFLHDMPRTATGKVHKRLLVEQQG